MRICAAATTEADVDGMDTGRVYNGEITSKFSGSRTTVTMMSKINHHPKVLEGRPLEERSGPFLSCRSVQTQVFEPHKLPRSDAADGIHAPQPCSYDKVASLQNSPCTYILPPHLCNEHILPGRCAHLDE
jgi:hypothetical protein